MQNLNTFSSVMEIRYFRSSQQIYSYFVNQKIPFQITEKIINQQLYVFAHCLLCSSSNYLAWIQRKDKQDKFQLVHKNKPHKHATKTQNSKQRRNNCLLHDSKNMKNQSQNMKNVETNRFQRNSTRCSNSTDILHQTQLSQVTQQSDGLTYPQKPYSDKKIFSYLRKMMNKPKKTLNHMNRQHMIRLITGKFKLSFGKSLDYLERFLSQYNHPDNFQHDIQQDKHYEKTSKKTSVQLSAVQKNSNQNKILDMEEELISLQFPQNLHDNHNQWYRSYSPNLDPFDEQNKLHNEVQHYFTF